MEHGDVAISGHGKDRSVAKGATVRRRSVESSITCQQERRMAGVRRVSRTRAAFRNTPVVGATRNTTPALNWPFWERCHADSRRDPRSSPLSGSCRQVTARELARIVTVPLPDILLQHAPDRRNRLWASSRRNSSSEACSGGACGYAPSGPALTALSVVIRSRRATFERMCQSRRRRTRRRPVPGLPSVAESSFAAGGPGTIGPAGEPVHDREDAVQRHTKCAPLAEWLRRQMLFHRGCHLVQSSGPPTACRRRRRP